ncbi:uncharacterized protein LOC110519974 isoform X3 [Oncorhynchus mykiss]|uniref:uncharacterized protein LOC110519974 isoform X3 n=1 Tax=Oncorhynchus mykiss TaxID=8022 RepID=UPI0018779F4B|nr:uncharacterized protein LOC110519974 isoform X3 [Oncorhynchus mykiss]
MPAEHCEVSELIETMESSEPSAQSAEPCIISDKINNLLDYTGHQKVNGQMDPAVQIVDHYSMNGEHAEESKPFVHYNGHSGGYEQCINKPCEDYPVLHKHTNQYKSSELSKSFEECSQNCECFDFSKSSEHYANDCLASVFSQHCEHFTECFQSSEQCKSSDQHCKSFESSEPAENSEFLAQCKISDFIPDISESNESKISFEHYTGICEYSEKYNHIDDATEYNETTKPIDEDLKPSQPTFQQIEICGLFDSEFCIILEPIHSSDFNMPSQHYAEQDSPNESIHVSEVHEPSEQTLLAEQSNHQSIDYDMPSGHCELQNTFYEQRETSVQCELSEGCNYCESYPCQHKSTNDKCYEPSSSFYYEEDKSSECSSIETRSFESLIYDSINLDPLTDSAEFYEALVEEGAQDKSSSDIWESFDNCTVVVECEESNADEDKPHSDAVDGFFDLFDKEDTYTFAQRRPYTSCFEGGGVHELFFEQRKTHVSIMNEEETQMPCAKKGLEVFSQEVEEVDESYDACADDGQFNVDCADDETSASGSFADEESCESCFEEATAYEVEFYEAFVAEDNAIEAEAYEPFVEDEELCIAENEAGDAQANGPLVDEDNTYDEHSAEEASHGSSSDVSSVEDDEVSEGQNDQTYEPCFEEEETCDEEYQTICVAEDELYKQNAEDKVYGSYGPCDKDCNAYGCEHTQFSTEGEDNAVCTEACEPSAEEHHEYQSEANESNVNQEANGFCTEEDSHDQCNEEMDYDSTPETHLKDEVCTEERKNGAPCAEESESPESFEVITKDTALCTEGSKPAMPDGIEFNGDQTDSSTTSSEEIDERSKSSELCEQLNTPYLSQNWEEHNGVSEHLQHPESEDLSEQLSEKTSLPLDGAELSKDSIDCEPLAHHAEQTEPSEQSELDEKMQLHEFFKIVASEQISEESEEELSDDESFESCECEYCVPPREQVPAKPLLPQIKSKDSGKICVVIDLDETLVHSSFKPVNNADFIIPVEIDGTLHQQQSWTRKARCSQKSQMRGSRRISRSTII